MFKPLESNILSNINPILLKKKKKNFNIIYNLRKNWVKIIGNKYVKFTYIKDLKISYENQKILHIEVYNPTISFLLSAEIDNIIENITIYYGYKIIDNIKFIQRPRNIELNDKNPKNIDLHQEVLLRNGLENVKDEKLKSILFNLGKEVVISNNK
tara:strand:+ start:4724 stop:5188 length:465 start_codon:yes stop_codon:yes gene_type:complete